MKKVAFNLPNILTYGRIIVIPFIVIFILMGDNLSRSIAFALFILAAITDYFDGYLARTLDQSSSLGRMLDPIADKLLVASCLLILSYDHTIANLSLWAALIILAREILVSGLREFLAEIKVSVPVSWIAKWKTAIQLIAIGLLVLGPAGKDMIPVIEDVALACLWIAALLTLYTGYDYFVASLAHLLRDDRDD